MYDAPATTMIPSVLPPVRPMRDTLEALGFLHTGSWQFDAARSGLAWTEIDGRQAVLDAKNALYAFCEGETVRYIGKTTRSIRQRFQGYRRPGSTQATNRRCNAKIRVILEGGGTVDILVLADLHQLQWSFLKVNLAAGLEDALIDHFDPPWNATQGGRRRSETAEREAEQAVEDGNAAGDGAISTPPEADQASVDFSIRLGPTYYRLGYINPGIDASRRLGGHGELLSVCLGTLAAVVTSRIDRTANANGSVRILGNNMEIARWFQNNFDLGEIVAARILDPHRILLLAKTSRAAPSSGTEA